MASSPPSAPTVLSLEKGAESWTIVSDQVNRLVEAWELAIGGQGVAPEISEFAPTGRGDVLKTQILTELVKVDLDYRWGHGREPRRLDYYLQLYPQLEAAMTAELLLEECLLRHHAHEKVDPAEYRARFPRLWPELERLWQAEAASFSQSSSRQGARRALETYQPGESVDDFDLLTVLGKGAFARVFLARQRSMQRLVALKLSANRSREPQTLAQLDHDHIVRVYDQKLVDGRNLRLLYMQYVPGGTLHSVVPLVKKTPAPGRSGVLLVRAVREALESRGESDRLSAQWSGSAEKLPWSEAICRLGIQLASALDHAHRQGVLHRDLKPANVLLTGDGSAKLADFNISFSANTAGATPAAYFGGSLGYMSPEQLEAYHPLNPRSPDSLDGRSDLYSLGVMLWELLHGERPFPDERVEEDWSITLDRMIERRQEQRTAEHPALPASDGAARALQQVLERALAPDVGQRFQSGAEFARYLDLALDRRAWSLLTDVNRGWRGMVRRYPTTITVAGVLVPNMTAAAFNLWYNDRYIIGQLPGTEVIFWRIQSIINATAFPFGVFWALRGVRGVYPAVISNQSAGPEIRKRTLYGGLNSARVCLTLWLIAGFAYPIMLREFAGHIPLWAHLHFILSLSLWGLVAAVYPFFTVTWLHIKAYYPPMIDLTDPTIAEDAPHLRAIRSWCETGAVLSAVVPLLALVVLVATQSSARPAMLIAAAGGLGAFVVSSLIFRELREDIGTLLRVVQGEATDSRR